MNSVSQNEKTVLTVKINEAEVYHSMGLLVEALDAYENILSDIHDLPAHSRNKIKEQIDSLREEIAEQEKIDPNDVSAKDISIFTRSISDQENIQVLLDSASAFKEMGLYEEAITQYEKLFHLGYPSKKVIFKIAGCLMKIHSPDEVAGQLVAIISEAGLEKKKMARIIFSLGKEMDKRNIKNLAVDLYLSAKEIDPENMTFGSIIDTQIAQLSAGSRYDYLINQRILTGDQIQQALEISSTTKNSAEFILIDAFKVMKEDLGKSLSLFFDCPFIPFDPHLPIPAELIKNLSKDSLLNELWVPINWGKKGIEIIIDDPGDTNRTDRIRDMLNIEKINFSVAIKEDIEAFINFFYSEKEDLPGTAEEPVSGVDIIPENISSQLVELRKEERISPQVPDFVSAEFSLVKTSGKSRTYRLKVFNCSPEGIGLLVPNKYPELLEMINPGDRIKDITLYATWTLIKVDAVVRHKTKIEEGAHKGQYIIGVKSNEIIENARLI